MEELETYPLAFGELSPGDGFTRMTFARQEGKPPEGVHTGGPFLSPDGEEVWKPLDCKPFPNANMRVATREAECLAVMAGLPGFPKNWRVEYVNGRCWLVRKKAYVLPNDEWGIVISREHVATIEQGLRHLNVRGWTISDPLVVAMDADTYEVFVLDLSCAHEIPIKSAAQWLYADDSERFLTWAGEVANFSDIVQLRRNARRAVSNARWAIDHPEHQWVYGSWYRPLGEWNATIPGALYVDADKRKTDYHSWVITCQPLEDEILRRYQLTWGYGPIQYQ